MSFGCLFMLCKRSGMDLGGEMSDDFPFNKLFIAFSMMVSSPFGVSVCFSSSFGVGESVVCFVLFEAGYCRWHGHLLVHLLR